MSVPRVVYAGFGTARHSGGVHVMAQHVTLLRAAGIEAWMWLPGTDRPGWFDETLPLLFGPTLDVGADDLLVLPEVPVVAGHDPAPGARKVIFNQNQFYTFAAESGTAGAAAPYPGWSPVPPVWTVSDESAAVLRAVHRDLAVRIIPCPVDTDLFRPREHDGVRVAWLPRKRPLEAALLSRLLRADERLHLVALDELVHLVQDAVAAALGRAAVFIALSHTESFGLPVAEALSAGCVVIGYDGGGGTELFDAPGAFRVPEQRPLLVVDKVAELINRPAELAALGRANRAWLVDRYSPAFTRRALLDAVTAALAGPGTAATAVHPAAWLDAVPATFTVSG